MNKYAQHYIHHYNYTLQKLAEFGDIMTVLEANKDKEFVKRILNPDSSPKLDLGDGNYATHKMAWGDIDTPEGKRFIAYPTILMGQNGQLIDYKDKVMEHVLKTNNFIEFNDPKKAEWFSTQYKTVWDK